MRRAVWLALVAAAVCACVTAVTAGAKGKDDRLAKKVDHIVVVYEENHSFDNLYGGWEGVNGRANADAAHTTQVDQAGNPFACLLQNDVNLTVPPLPPKCSATSAFVNAPFAIDDYIPATGPKSYTCPQPGVFAPNGLLPSPSNLPGGCTRDIVHRFYSEQFQLDNGKQDRYTLGSDAAGLTQGYYKTELLPIYRYLHSKHHPDYVIADDFFQAAFGGSFLNHQWLIAARTPLWEGGPDAQHSVVDSNGMPTSTPLYTPTGPVVDSRMTVRCSDPHPAGLACGDYAVNTTQPPYQPYAPGTSPSLQLSPQKTATIGDELTAAGVSWAWYSGGWSNAAGVIGGPGWTNGDGPTCSDPNTAAGAAYPNCPNKVFQYHHQPFNYFFNYRPGTFARSEHLRDEAEFLQLARSSDDHTCNLAQVSFVKPIGLDNEHPGYTSESAGSDHLVELLQAIEGSACAKDTMVVVTYDEFGGQWDHVSPPGQGGTAGPHDQWGPGTRIPALILAPGTHGPSSVDHTQYDTTSILATIEHRFDLAPLSSRDAAVNDLSGVFDAKEVHGNAKPGLP